jgi:hypothetical protein
LESDEKNYFISTQNLPSGQTVQTRIMTMAAQERRKMYEDEIAFLKGGKEEIDKILKGRQDDNRALIGIINQEEYHVGQLQLKVKEAGIYEDILKRQYDLSLAQTNLDRARAGEGPLSWETLNAGDMAMLRMRMNMGMVRADADAFWKKFNQETSKMAGQGAALLQMPEVNALGQKQLAIQLLQKELYYTDDITGNLKKQEILRSEMKFLMMSTTEKTQMEMNALSTGLNAAQQGMALFGIQSDSVIGKLIQMVQLAQTLAELISALNFLGLFSGGTSAVTTVLKYGGVVTLPKTTPGGRKQLMKLIADSERKGFSY